MYINNKLKHITFWNGWSTLLFIVANTLLFIDYQVHLIRFFFGIASVSRQVGTMTLGDSSWCSLSIVFQSRVTTGGLTFTGCIKQRRLYYHFLVKVLPWDWTFSRVRTFIWLWWWDERRRRFCTVFPLEMTLWRTQSLACSWCCMFWSL
jgi:hypothetical protein